MTVLIIRDIKESDYSHRTDLITAIILSDKIHNIDRVPLVAKRVFDDLLVLESATATEELPAIAVHRGEQFLRIWAKSNHGFNVGDKIRFEDSDDIKSSDGSAARQNG